VVYELHRGDLLLDHPFRESRAVDHDASGVEELFVVPVVHCVYNVCDVVACVGFPGHVDLLVLEAEGFDKVLEEAEELLGGVFFGGGGGGALGEAGSYGLVDPVLLF